ncbi:hypothetical protein [Shewanella donghaensis]|uniref:hypothetical protein n=1 Tax=Shewanella donghaensis TaxID=238836 RepID=UPI0011840692|nr:hypothetical protein [Shewanella donghaensis]
MANKARWFSLVLLAFFFVFAFPIPIFGNSAYIALVITLILLLCSQEAVNLLTGLLRNRFLLLSLSLLVSLFLVSFITTTLHNEYDYVILRTMANNIFSLLGAAALSCLVYVWGSRKNIIDLMVHILFLQTFFILIMLISPEIRDVIQSLIRTDSQMERMATYNNVRGLGISGSVAFGLAITMGFLIFLLHYWVAVYKENLSSLFTFTIFIFCVLAALSAGRTAVLGFVIGFVFYLFSMSLKTLFSSSLKQLVIFLAIVTAVGLYIMSNEFLMEIAFLYSRYVFRFVWNYMESGSFEVNSLTALDKMYFIPPIQETLLGSGQYVTTYGTHYMHTDSGYMRFMLFFGGIISFFMYCAFILISFEAYTQVRDVMKYSGIFFLTFVFMSFVFQYKGEVVFFGVAYMKIFFLITFYFIILKKLKTESITANTIKPLSLPNSASI